MPSAVIIDDEENGRLALRQKLKNYCPGITVLGEADTGLAGIELIRRCNPEIVFLDIEMPGMDGFEMLARLEHKSFHLIFTTAYDQYAIKAIRYAAFDYLLKPIDIEELKSTLERLSQTTEASFTAEKFDTLQKNLLSKPFLNKIAIPSQDGLVFHDIQNIMRLEAESNYTTIYFADGSRFVASRTLKDFEEILPTDAFFRTHHSHIINLNFLRRYIRGDGGLVELTNGTHVLVSRSKKEEFLKHLGRV